MRKVDVIFPDYINKTIGPCGTLRRLNGNKDYLKSRGYDLTIYTLDLLNKDGDHGNTLSSNEIASKEKGVKVVINRILYKSRIFAILKTIRVQKLAGKLVNRYLTEKSNPDILVFHEPDCCYDYISKNTIGAKTVCFFHNDGSRWKMFFKSRPQLVNARLFMRWMNKRMDRMIEKLDQCVFIAKIGQETFLKENPSVPIEKTSFFHNGIDDKPIIYKTTERSFKYNLCCTGTVSERKGQYLVVEALHKMDPEKRVNIHFSVFGGGKGLDDLRGMVNAYNLNDNVTLYGNVPNDMIHDKLCQEDIFILMSNNEGLPISIIEAMRAGLPIISTPIDGIPEEVEPDYNGLLVDLDSDKLTDIFNHIEEYDWETMSGNSRKRFENEFSFDQMIKSYCDMLDKI